MTVVLFLGGLQLIGIGIVGEYLGRIFNETMRRPLYLLTSVLLPDVCQVQKHITGEKDVKTHHDHHHHTDR